MKFTWPEAMEVSRSIKMKWIPSFGYNDLRRYAKKCQNQKFYFKHIAEKNSQPPYA